MTPGWYQLMLDRWGGQPEILPERARWDLLQRWREVYAAGLFAATGHWKQGQFEWHGFSSGYAHSLSGGRGLVASATEPPPTPGVRSALPAISDLRLSVSL